MENVNRYINLKQYFLIPLITILVIFVAILMLGAKDDMYENDDITLNLNKAWMMSTDTEGSEVVFTAIDNTQTTLSIKKLEPYVFGIKAGHIMYNSVLYEGFQNNEVEELSIHDNDATCFNFKYLDNSKNEPISMVSKELVVSIDESLYSIGIYCAEAVSEKYFSNFDQLISSLDFKNK